MKQKEHLRPSPLLRMSNIIKPSSQVLMGAKVLKNLTILQKR